MKLLHSQAEEENRLLFNCNVQKTTKNQTYQHIITQQDPDKHTAEPVYLAQFC